VLRKKTLDLASCLMRTISAASFGCELAACQPVKTCVPRGGLRHLKTDSHASPGRGHFTTGTAQQIDLLWRLPTLEASVIRHQTHGHSEAAPALPKSGSQKTTTGVHSEMHRKSALNRRGKNLCSEPRSERKTLGNNEILDTFDLRTARIPAGDTLASPIPPIPPPSG
jgi:hypothetical protein